MFSRTTAETTPASASDRAPLWAQPRLSSNTSARASTSATAVATTTSGYRRRAPPDRYLTREESTWCFAATGAGCYTVISRFRLNAPGISRGSRASSNNPDPSTLWRADGGSLLASSTTVRLAPLSRPRALSRPVRGGVARSPPRCPLVACPGRASMNLFLLTC